MNTPTWLSGIQQFGMKDRNKVIKATAIQNLHNVKITQIFFTSFLKMLMRQPVFLSTIILTCMILPQAIITTGNNERAISVEMNLQKVKYFWTWHWKKKKPIWKGGDGKEEEKNLKKISKIVKNCNYITKYSPPRNLTN